MEHPTLYVDDRSPPVRSILMLIEELKLTADVTIKPIDLFKRENWSESYLKMSPMHTVPAFVHDDLVLNDSHSILVYLAESFDNGQGLWSSDLRSRSKIIDRLLFNATILFRRDSEVFVCTTRIKHFIVRFFLLIFYTYDNSLKYSDRSPLIFQSICQN